MTDADTYLSWKQGFEMYLHSHRRASNSRSWSSRSFWRKKRHAASGELSLWKVRFTSLRSFWCVSLARPNVPSNEHPRNTLGAILPSEPWQSWPVVTEPLAYKILWFSPVSFQASDALLCLSPNCAHMSIQAYSMLLLLSQKVSVPSLNKATGQGDGNQEWKAVHECKARPSSMAANRTILVLPVTALCRLLRAGSRQWTQSSCDRIRFGALHRGGCFCRKFWSISVQRSYGQWQPDRHHM